MKQGLGLTGAAVVVMACAGCGSSANLEESLDGGKLDGSAEDSGKSHKDGAADSGKSHEDASKDTGSPTDAREDRPSTHTDAEADAEPDAEAGAEEDASVVPTPPPDFLWYVLDETTGTIAHDSSPKHNDITVPGITWNGGGVFDGKTTCGSTTVGEEYRSPPVTVSGWLTPAERTDEPTTAGALLPYPPNALSDDVPSLGGYGFGLNVWSHGSALEAEEVSPCTMGGLCVANGTQNRENADAGDAGFSCTSTTTCNQGFKAGTRYFITVTFDALPDGGTTDSGTTEGGTTDSGSAPMAQVYVNGVLFDQDTSRVPPASPSPPLQLGCHNDDTTYETTRFYDGEMRDVRVYLRQLAADEVKQLYKNGPTLHAPPRSDAGSSDASKE